EDWREHAIARPRTGKQHSMGIKKEPANSRFLQERVDGRGIGAFGQPDATRVCPETGSIMVARGENLAAQRSGMLGEQRQYGMRRGGSNNLQFSSLLEFPERADNVFAVGAIDVPERIKAMMIDPGKRLIILIPIRAMDFAFRKLDQRVEMIFVAVLQQWVQKHGAQGRAQRKRESRVHAFAEPSVHDLDQGEVAFGHGFKEPVFLQKLFVLGMPDERKMRVK